MDDSRQPTADSRQVLRFLLRPRSRWVICWLIALGSLGFVGEQAWTCFDTPKRADGNWGHASIDFGGQWIMGRMIVEGFGRQLYQRPVLRRVAEENYPADAGEPEAEKTDAESILGWMAGSDDDDPPIGGALYPPVHALLFAPLATLPPPIAYRVFQALLLLLVCFDAWVVRCLTEGRIWWSVALVFILMFPGCFGAINLGQNAILSLTCLLIGWWQLSRGRPVLAGVCWGLLAFKPVWAASFFVVPLLTGRWRMAATMALTGLVQIALTLPVVGLQSWLEWLQVGQLAAIDYTIQENWIFLSRDLMGLPRRCLLTFQDGIARGQEWEQFLCAVIGWTLWSVVLGITLLIVWLRRRQVQALTGPAAAFVLLGSVCCCYHFMYYDTLLAVLPVLVLFTEPRRYLQAVPWRPPRWLTRRASEPPDMLPAREWQRYYQPGIDDLAPPPMPLLPGGRSPRWVRAPMAPLLCFLILFLPAVCYLSDQSNHYPPGDTFGLLLLWAWCGYRLLKDRTTAQPGERLSSVDGLAVNGAIHAVQLAELGPDVGRAHEGLADQNRADASRL
jgi:hypothetical protein